jgi:hypothetical protein
METSTVSGSFLLTSPNAIGLPAAERGDAPASVTRATVNKQWPQIERLLADGQVPEAIRAMESLAAEMRAATAGDAPLFRDALTSARRILYDDLAQLGRTAKFEEPTRTALYRCATWDEELRLYLEQLIASL